MKELYNAKQELTAPPSSEAPINRSLVMLKGRIDRLGAMIETMESKLATVMRLSPDNCPQPDPCQSPNVSPMTATLNAQSDRIADAAMRIEKMLEAIEL